MEKDFNKIDVEVRNLIAKLNEHWTYLRNKDMRNKLDEISIVRANVVLYILRTLVKVFGE